MDILAPLGILALILVFVVALIRAGRRAKRLRLEMFREYASRHGWEFQEKDEGRAQALGSGFDEFAQFYSPSLGKLIPQCVVRGNVEEGGFCVFVHNTRRVEGDERLWYVCVVDTGTRLCRAISIKVRQGRFAKRTELGANPVVPFPDGPFERRFIVRCADAAEATRLLMPAVQEFLVEAAKALPFRPAIQMRESRLAVYLADRNADLESAEEIGRLVTFSRELAAIVGRRAGDLRIQRPAGTSAEGRA